MNEVEHVESWQGQTVVDPSGAELGKVDEIFFDAAGGAPVLMSVKSGLLGRRSALVPIEGATFGRDYVRVTHTQETVNAAGAGFSGEAPNHDELAALGEAYGSSFPDQLELESASERDARNAEAQAARQRAAELAAAARDKLEQRDAAGERAMSAKAEADQAQADAEQARLAALEAREQAKRYE